MNPAATPATRPSEPATMWGTSSAACSTAASGAVRSTVDHQERPLWTVRSGASRQVPDTDVNATAAALLGLLDDGPATGYDLVGAAQEFLGDFWTVTRSQVYRELAAMADRGLVTAGAAGPRDRRPYQVTAEGRAAF